MREGYLILSAGQSGDFGSCSLISKEIWDILNGDKELSDISEELYEELSSAMNINDKEEFLEEIQFSMDIQEFHCFLANLDYNGKSLSSAKYFNNLHLMVKYVKDHDIEVLDTDF